MELIVSPSGRSRCVYDETIPLDSLGKPEIRRASHVEPNASGGWLADLSPVSGPLLGPFELRSYALAAERDWLLQHWLASTV